MVLNQQKISEAVDWPDYMLRVRLGVYVTGQVSSTPCFWSQSGALEPQCADATLSLSG